ncbi:unnamed protein product [Rhizophagus irregularis]|nr:unnamed protein product [Rhizophagus irregularis]
MGNPVASGVDSKFFQSLRKYAETQSVIKGKISIPNVLGLNIYENAVYLRSIISHLPLVKINSIGYILGTRYVNFNT